MKKKKKREPKDWQCFQCGFEGTDKQVLDHECPGMKTVRLPDGKRMLIR